MKLTVNGMQMELPVMVLGDVLRHHELQDKMVVTEVDGVIVERGQWETMALQEGMKIELVHFVGGG